MNDPSEDYEEVFRSFFNNPNFLQKEDFIHLTVPTLANLLRICDMLHSLTTKMYVMALPLAGAASCPNGPPRDEITGKTGKGHGVPDIPKTEAELANFKNVTYEALGFPKENDECANAEIFNAGYNDWIIAMFLSNVEKTTLIYRKVARVMAHAVALERIMMEKFGGSTQQPQQGSSTSPQKSLQRTKNTRNKFTPSPQKSSCPRNTRNKFTPSPPKSSCAGKSRNKSTPTTQQKVTETENEAVEGAKASSTLKESPTEEVPEADKKDRAEGGGSGEGNKVTDLINGSCWNEWRVVMILKIYSCQMIVLKKKVYLARLVQYCLQQDAKLNHQIFGTRVTKISSDPPLPKCNVQSIPFPQTEDALTNVRSTMLDLIQNHAGLNPEPAAPEPAVVSSGSIAAAAAPEPAEVSLESAEVSFGTIALAAARLAAAVRDVAATPVETGQVNQASGGSRRKVRPESRRPDSLIKPKVPPVAKPVDAKTAALAQRRFELMSKAHGMLEQLHKALGTLQKRLTDGNKDIVEDMNKLKLADEAQAATPLSPNSSGSSCPNTPGTPNTRTLQESPDTPKDVIPKKPSKKALKNQMREERRKKK